MNKIVSLIAARDRARPPKSAGEFTQLLLSRHLAVTFAF